MKAFLFLSSAAIALASPALASRVIADTGTTAPADSVAIGRSGVGAADRVLADASARGLIDALSGALTDDAVLLYPGEPIVRGRAMALAVLEGLPSSRSIRMTWQAVRGEISSDGTHAYTSGYGRRLTAGGDDSTYMRYIAYWRLSGGRWRVAALVIAPGAMSGTAAPSGCESPATTFNASTRADVNAVRRALLATDSSFSARSARDGAAVAFSEYIADDGANLGGAAEMICGRAAIASEMRDAVPGALVWTPRLVDAAPSGDLGFTVGIATVTHGSERHTSKYLTVWKKQRDGSWRFIADGGNPAPAS